MESSPEIPLQELVDALLDEESPLEARYLQRLSGLEGDELSTIEGNWGKISSQRRLRLLQGLEALAEESSIVDFDAICQIAIGDETAETRSAALRLLWECDDPALAKRLLEILDQDDEEEVRAQAAAGLGRFIYLGELEKLPQEDLEAVEDKLLAVMDSEAPALIRQRALESLGYSSRSAVREHIEEAYEYGDEDWLVSALYAMGRSADPAWEPEVLDKLDHVQAEVRQEAARAAGELELAEAAPGLLTLLGDSDEEVRMAAAWSLSEIGGSDVREALEELLEISESEAEVALLESALENLEFTEELGSFNLLELSEEDLDGLANPGNSED